MIKYGNNLDKRYIRVMMAYYITFLNLCVHFSFYCQKHGESWEKKFRTGEKIENNIKRAPTYH